MIKGSVSIDLYHSYLDIIKDEQAREAYAYLVGSAALMKNHDCFPDHHGKIPDFRYYQGDDYLFAFIPNQKWLLFYFRLPSQKLDRFSREMIYKFFPETKENTSGEFTIRISTLAQAVKLAKFIGN